MLKLMLIINDLEAEIESTNSLFVKSSREYQQQIRELKVKAENYREALEKAVQTIHNEFCCGDEENHHPFCERPREVLDGK